MERRNNIIAIAIWICSVAILLMADVVVFFLPLVLWPHAVTHVAIVKMEERSSQKLLLVAMLAYFLWAGFLFAISINAGAWAGLGVVFASFWAAPVLALLWLCAFTLNRRGQHHPARYQCSRTEA